MGHLAHPREKTFLLPRKLFGYLTGLLFFVCLLVCFPSGKCLNCTASLFHHFFLLHISISSPLPLSVHDRKSKPTD